MISGKKIILYIAAFAVAVSCAVPAGADSLWKDDASLFSDRKAAAVGDILLVRVNESIKDSDEGETSTTKTTNEDMGSGFGILSFLRAFGIKTSTNMNGNTTVERTKSSNVLVSCIVTDVTPNGNLVIEGERTLLSGAEKMSVRFSGVVRRQDVGHNNTVDSTRVANPELMVNGKGVISRTQRPGLINQILQAIF
jgi:flagellar L-ring protein precursor FlgH